MTNVRSYRALFVGTLVVLMIGVASLTSWVFFQPSWQRYRASRAVEALVRAVEAQDGDEFSRLRPLLAMKDIDGGRQAIPRLHGLLKCNNPEVRMGAIWALEGLKNEQAVPALLDGLKDLDPRVRLCAVAALNRFRSPQLVPLLTEASSDPDPLVASQATMILRLVQWDQDQEREQ